MLSAKTLIRVASLCAVMLAGSCAAPTQDANGLTEDGAVNHPITVEPSYQSLKLSYSAAGAGLMAQDSERFDAFIADYRAHGNGAISISAPNGTDAHAAIGFFAERIAAEGVPRSAILVSTHDPLDGDMRVEIDYVTYQAHADDCGDWSSNLANTLSNETAPNFGCSVQHNIAAQIADPRDLLGPRTMTASDAVRRNTVAGHYEKGEITQADKHMADKSDEQAGISSSVGR